MRFRYDGTAEREKASAGYSSVDAGIMCMINARMKHYYWPSALQLSIRLNDA